MDSKEYFEKVMQDYNQNLSQQHGKWKLWF